MYSFIETKLFSRLVADLLNDEEYSGPQKALIKVEGHNYKTAATELGVSFNTICFHSKQIYEKMQVHSKSEAVAKALRNRLIS